ncbi:MAG: choline/carnitine O-acyltransferase, partial [Waddliaceae bacterium]
MVSGEDDNEKKRKLLEEAIQSQSEYTKNAFLGRGVDRRLLGLKLLAQKKGLKLEIFEGKAYNIPWTLSTSQTPCPNFPGGGFSPNESNGYGVAYVVNPNQLFFHITSKHSSGLSSSEAFMEALRQSLEEMKGLFSPPA